MAHSHEARDCSFSDRAEFAGRCFRAAEGASLPVGLPDRATNPRWQFVPNTAAVGWIGAALTVAGIAFAIRTRFHIGRNWSGFVTLKEGHTLVRTGPYALVRHPIYKGLLLAVLATAIVHRALKGLIGFVLLLIEWKRKSLVEDRLMIEQFGAEYFQYRREVKGLLPFLW